jgi:thioesterase domain-containing protein
MTDASDCLVPLRESGDRTPVYCVHPVSGSPYVYAGLAKLLGDDQPVYGVEAPGFDNDRPLATTLLALAHEYVEAIRAHRPGRPVVLLGWSMGGSVAYEMARLRAAAGEPVPLLVVIDSAVPDGWGAPPERWMVQRFLLDLVAISGLAVQGLDEVIETLPEETDANAVFERIEAAGILDEELDADFLADRYEVFRAHVRALHTHTITPGYAGPLLLIKATGSDQEYMHWERFASAVSDYAIESDHHGLWVGDRLNHMAEIITARLSSVGPET